MLLSVALAGCAVAPDEASGQAGLPGLPSGSESDSRIGTAPGIIRPGIATTPELGGLDLRLDRPDTGEGTSMVYDFYDFHCGLLDASARPVEEYAGGPSTFCGEKVDFPQWTGWIDRRTFMVATHMGGDHVAWFVAPADLPVGAQVDAVYIAIMEGNAGQPIQVNVCAELEEVNWRSFLLSSRPDDGEVLRDSIHGCVLRLPVDEEAIHWYRLQGRTLRVQQDGEERDTSSADGPFIVDPGANLVIRINARFPDGSPSVWNGAVQGILVNYHMP